MAVRTQVTVQLPINIWCRGTRSKQSKENLFQTGLSNVHGKQGHQIALGNKVKETLAGAFQDRSRTIIE